MKAWQFRGGEGPSISAGSSMTHIMVHEDKANPAAIVPSPLSAAMLSSAENAPEDPALHQSAARTEVSVWQAGMRGM